MTRNEARELMMQLLFQMDVQNDYSVEAKDNYLNNIKKLQSQKNYMENIYNQIIENKVEIDSLLNDCSEKWNISRMGKVDLAILRLSIAEIMYNEDIPDSVSINEAVNLAKKFSSQEASKFINGILGKVVKLKNE